MKHILDMLNPVLDLRVGVESLEKDVELLSAFMSHANGCGLESLDTPSGKIIESGLAARYPDHFQMGSGLEGIKELVTKLKDGIAGLKKKLKGGIPPQLKNAVGELDKAINATYGDRAWYDKLTETNKPVSTVELAKLIGNIKTAGDVVTTVAAAGKAYDTVINTNLKDTVAYIARTQKIANQLNRLGKNELELTKYANEQIAILKPLFDKLEIFADIKSGTGVTDLKLTKDQCIAIGAEMARTVKWWYDDLVDSEHLYVDAVGDSDLNSTDITEFDAVGELYYNYMHWESVLGSNERLAMESGRLIKEMLFKMEAMIITALK